MSIEIKKGIPDIQNEYIDFITDAFGFDGVERNFRTLLPKLYGEGRTTATENYFVFEDNEIKSCVGSFPIEFEIDGTVLKVRGIGNVGTRSDSRGRGFMKMLMDKAKEDMLNEGIDLSVLGGRRHRYNFHGYEKCDGMMRFHTTQKVLSYLYPDFIPVFSVKKVEKDDEKILDDIYENLSCVDYRAKRSRKDLFDIMSSWKSVFYAFYDKDKLIGWAILYGGGETVTEFVPIDHKNALEMALTLIKDYSVSSFVLPPFYEDVITDIMKISENVSIVSNECFCIFNWEKVVRTLFIYKSKKGLSDGRLDIKINDSHENIRFILSVDNGKASLEVIPFDADSKPDYELDHLEAERFFFMTLSPERFGMKSDFASWFPLPLCISEVDNV